METSPKSMRLHLALMGRVNSGKSSFLNLVAGQDVAITSPQAGTTTDIVEKNTGVIAAWSGSLARYGRLGG